MATLGPPLSTTNIPGPPGVPVPPDCPRDDLTLPKECYRSVTGPPGRSFSLLINLQEPFSKDEGGPPRDRLISERNDKWSPMPSC